MLRLIPRDVATEMPKPRRRVRRRDTRFRPNWNAPAETLEVRIVPTTAQVWTGSGLTSDFSDQNNWGSHTIPQAGDSLDFPAGSENATPYDDLDGVGFGQITIEAAGYSLGSDAGLPTTGITTTFAAGSATITGGVTLLADTTTPASVAAGGSLDINGTIDGTSGLMLSGGGTLVMDGVTSNTYTGTTEVDDGTLQTAKLLNAMAIPGNLFIGDGTHTALVQDQNDNQFGPATAVTIEDHGTLDLAGNSDAVAGLTLHGGSVTTGPGTLTLDGDVTDDDTTAPLTISGNLVLGVSTVTFHVSPGATLELDASIDGGGLGVAGGGTLRLAGSGTNTYAGTTRVDGSTLELDVTNPTIPAIPGALTINNEGTVRDLADYQMATGTIVTAIQGGALDLNGHDDAISGLYFDGGSVTTGAGTLTLLGDIVVEDDVLATSSISGQLALGQSIHVTVTPNVTLDISAVISGAGYGLSLDALAALPGVTGLPAGGTLVFSGTSANTYTGTTTVAQGELQLSKADGVAAVAGPLVVGDAVGDAATVRDEADNQLGSGIAVTVHSNATLALYSHNDAVGPLLLLGGWVTTENAGTDTFGDLTLDGPVAAEADSTIYGTITLGADTTFTVATGKTLTLNGPIDGSHGLTLAYSQTLPDSTIHQGGGTIVMEGTMSGPTANTYSGTTAIQSGTLHLAKALDTVGVPGLLLICDPNGNAATVEEDSTQIRVGGTVEIYGGGLLQLADNDQGLGTLKLHGTQDGTVVDTVNGVLTLSGSIVDDSTASLRIGGSVFLYDNVTVTVDVGGTLTLDAVVAGNDGKGLTLAAPIAPGGQGLASGGTLVMAGMDGNTYNGTTTVEAGTLLLDKGCGAIAIAGPLVVGGPAGLPAAARDQADGQLDGMHDVTLDQGGLFDLNGHNDAAESLVLQGGTAKSGAGLLTINNDVVYPGANPTPTLLAANLNLNSDNPTFDISRGETLIVQGVISGGNGFRLDGSGTLELWGSSVSNTYTGTVTLNMGTLILDNAAGTTAITGDLVIGTGCRGNVVRELESDQIASTSHVTVGYRSLLDLADNNQTAAGLTFDNGTVLLGAGALTLNGDVSTTGWGVIENNRSIDGPNVNQAPEGRLDLGGSRIFDIADSTDLAIDALVTDGSVIKAGLGDLEFYDDANSYSGSTQVNAGTLYARGWNALGQTSGSTVDNGATLVLDGVTTSGLAITLGGGAVAADSTLKIDEGDDNAVTPSNNVNTITNLVLDGDATIYVNSGTAENVHGISSGNSVNHRLTLQGGGSLHAVGSVTNDGAIVVDGGTLDVAADNPLTGAVTVENNGQLGGSSAIGGVTSTGGTVGALGSYSPQTLAVASLGLDSGSTFKVDIAGNTPGTGGYDQVVTTGAVTLGEAALSINLAGYTPQAGDTFTIIKGSVVPPGNFNGLAEGSLIQAGGYSFRITYQGGAQGHDIVLSYVQASTTTLATSSFIATYGQTVTLTATVTAGTSSPIGSVTFTEGSTVLGTVPLTPLGTAALPLGNLSVGYHRIVATYSGSSAFTSSASTATGQVIKQAATGTSLGLSASSIGIGQSVTLTATVAPAVGNGTPSGTVRFYDGSTMLATVSLAAGKATFATSSLAAGSHALSAVYTGDTNYVGGTSAAAPLAVNPISTSTVLGTYTSSIVIGQAASFVAYVSWANPGSGSPAGSVTFMDGSTVLGHAALVNGWATLVTSALGIGGHGVTAAYYGNATAAVSQSTAVSTVVNANASTTTLASSIPQSVTGQSVTLTATVVAPGTASQTGTVTFLDGQTVLGTAPVVGGKTTLAVASMGVGYHYLYAIYGGNAQVYASYSPAIGQTVFKANTGTGFVSSARVATYGQMVTYSAAVAAVAPGAGTPSGSVSFYDGPTLLGSARLSGGTASLTVAATGVGLNHPITVRYSGDANYSASVSDVVTETVVKASAQMTAFEQVFPNAVGFPTAVLATTPGMATPTGTVTFFANGKKIGQATLVNGSAGIGVLGRGVLLQSVTVLYSGDANYNAATIVPQIIFV